MATATTFELTIGAPTQTATYPTHNIVNDTGVMNCWPLGDPWPWNTPNIYVYPNTGYYWPVPEPPRECSGDVHVFPCPHCDKCKCGQASVKRPKGKKSCQK